MACGTLIGNELGVKDVIFENEAEPEGDARGTAAVG
jgi:hypothetical protein